MDQRQNAAELKLRKLAVDLKKAYGRATRHITSELKPIEVALEEINEPWKPLHYAEVLQEKGFKDAKRPGTCFAHETAVNGTEVEYLLCVGRNQDMKCVLYVSVCKYQIKHPEDGDQAKEPEVIIKNSAVAPPTALPVPMRMRILDVLEEFAAAYEQHVRDVRKGVLAQWNGDNDAVEAEPVAEASEVEGSKEDEKGKGKVKLFSPEEMNTPLEQWIPALSDKR